MDEHALLRDVIARPGDDAPRLAYADAIASRDPDRATFIRAQLEASQRRRRGDDWGDQLRTIMALRPQQPRWTPRLPVRVETVYFHRGFPEHVVIALDGLIGKGEELAQVIPLRHVDVRGARGRLAELGRCAAFPRLVSIGLAGSELDDGDARAIAAWPAAPQLRWLDLSTNRIGRPGLDALAASASLRGIDWIDLHGNPCGNPVDSVAFESGVRGVVDVQWTPLGAELERVHGEIPWLHAPQRHTQHWPPDRADY